MSNQPVVGRVAFGPTPFMPSCGDEPTQAEIDGVAAVFKEVEDDPVAQASAYIMAKKLKRVFARRS